VGQGFEITGIGRMGRYATEATHLAYAGLVSRHTEAYRNVPWLAGELPSIERRTWTVNADGSMDTTWKLRPGIQWHDRVAFKASDFIFGWQVMGDPGMEFDSRGDVPLMDRLDAPDDRTLRIHWNRQFADADAIFSTLLFPLPSHILGELYAARDYEALNNHTY
jgi:peptide/nickel transport system substrate-binding protein